MNRRPTMITKTSWLVFGRITSHALSFVFYICLARVFGESGIGEYSYAFGIAALFGVGVQLGLRHLTTRNIVKDPNIAKDYYGNLFVLQFVLTIVLSFILYGVARRLDYSPSLQILTILAFISVALHAMGIGYVAFLEAVEEMHKSAILEILLRITIVALGFLFILVHADLKWIMGAHVIGGILYLSVAKKWVRNRFQTSMLKLNIPFIKKTFVAALPFTLSSALYVLYAKVDILMIHHFIGEEATGAYAAAYRCLEALFVISSMAGIAMYPVLSRSGNDARSNRDQLFLSSLKWLGLFGMVGSVILMTVGDNIFTLLFSTKFSESANLIQWMSILLLFGYLKVPYWRLLFATHREKTQIGMQAISVILNIIFNFYLIQRFGVYGAVWASIFSEFFLLVGFHLVCRNIVQANYTGMASRLVLAGICVFLLGSLVGSKIPWMITITILVLLMFGLSILFRFITLNDYNRFLDSLRASKTV